MDFIYLYFRGHSGHGRHQLAGNPDGSILKPRLLGEVIMDGGESVLCNADDSELGKL